jgi:hypothetical protein
MNILKTFEQYNKQNEGIDIGFTGVMGIILVAGALKGYEVVGNFIDKITFNKSKRHLKEIFDKLSQDKILQKLLDELLPYKNYLTSNTEMEIGEAPTEWGEDAPARDTLKKENKAIEMVNKINKRIKELLPSDEYEKFERYNKNYLSKGGRRYLNDDNVRYSKWQPW